MEARISAVTRVAGQRGSLRGRLESPGTFGDQRECPRHYVGACCHGRSTLPKHNKFSNFFVIEIPVVFSRQFFLNKETYIANLPPKSTRETKVERTGRFQRMLEENGWTRAELARQMGVSRAWVSKVMSFDFTSKRLISEEITHDNIPVR